MQPSVLVDKPQSRKKMNSSNKSRFDVELPKINKTAFLLSNKPSLEIEESAAFVAKIQWVMQQCDYSHMSQHQIQLEYRKLRKQLLLINEDVAFAIQKMNSRPLKKSKNTNLPLERVVEIRDKEVENNIAIIERLKKQLENLQKRTMACNSTSKDEVETQIEQIKEKIIKARLKIKQLKLKSKAMGNSIENSDNIYDQIRALENERQAYDKKRMKIQQKYDKACFGIDKMISKIQEIHPQYEIAQKYCEQWSQQHKEEGQERRVSMNHRQKLYMLEITQKNLESINQSKQQKYHQTLKNLQSAIQKSEKANQKINECQIKVLESKSVILDLEEKLQELIEKSKEENVEPTMFFTQIKAKGEQIQLSELGDLKDDKNGKNKVKTYSKHKQRSARNSESRQLESIKARISQLSHHDNPHQDPPHFTKETVATHTSTELPHSLQNHQKKKISINSSEQNGILTKPVEKKENTIQLKPKIDQGKLFKRKNSEEKRESKIKTEINDFQIDKIEDKVKKISRPSGLKKQQNQLKIQPPIQIKKQAIKQQLQPIKKQLPILKKQQIPPKKQIKQENKDLFIDNIDQKFKFEPKLLNQSHFDKQTQLNDTSPLITSKKSEKNKIQEKKQPTEAQRQKNIIDRYMKEQESDDESMKDFKESIKQNKGRISQKIKINIDLGSIQDRISKVTPS